MSRESSWSDCSSWPFSRATAAWLASVSSRRRSSGSKCVPSPSRLMMVSAPMTPALADERADHRLADGVRIASSSRGPVWALKARPSREIRERSGSSISTVHRDHRLGPVGRAGRAPQGRRERSGRGRAGARRARRGTSGGRGRAARRWPSRAPARSAGAGSTRRGARAARASRAPRCRPGRRGTRSPVGTASRTIERTSTQRTVTASIARLVLAIATISLKLSISGQLPELRRAAGQRDRRGDERRLERAGGPGRGERGQPLLRTRRHGRRRDGVEDGQGDDGGQAELGEVERALDARLAVIREEGEAGPDEAGREVLGRRQEEQPDDARQLAQRERVALAQEVDLDDVGLAEVERPGPRGATGSRTASAARSGSG